MSGTDKTHPWWVRARDCIVEVHDHRNGVCDIEGQVPTRENIGWRRGQRCYFDGDWGNPESGLWCGCPYCAGKLWRSKHGVRAEGKRATRNWWREY